MRQLPSSNNACVLNTTNGPSIAISVCLTIPETFQQFLRLSRSAPLGLGSSLTRIHHNAQSPSTQKAPSPNAPNALGLETCVSLLNPLPSTMAHPPQRKRGWWREFFEDHPGLSTKAPESYTNPNASRPDKHRVWCKQCFVRRIVDEQARDEKEIELGNRVSVRDESTIKNTCTCSVLLL